MEEITAHISRISDTCSVYALERDGKCVLIDCGTDLADGVSSAGGQNLRIDTVLLTHFHRDQCSAAPALQRRGARIIVPYCERRLLEEADAIRASYDIYDNYRSYRECFGPADDVRADGYAMDYARIEANGVSFEVVPLPGHTFGSVGYLLTADGARILAVGDCMSGAETLHEYASTQWTYMDFQGHANHLESLATIDRIRPDIILPGHGSAFAFDAAALGRLRTNLERLYEMFYARPFAYFEPEFTEVSPHFVQVSNSGSSTYFVRDDSGNALCIDCGYVSRGAIVKNPHRFIDNLTPWLHEKAGIDRVEWFLCSHYHDDHLAGYPCLRERYGTRMAAAPGLKDILEHPERYDVPCLLPQGLEVSRTVEPGEPFEWRGYAFAVDQAPGQTIYNQEIRFEADGKKYMAIGDSISGLGLREKRDHIYSFTPWNRTPLSAYGSIPERLRAYRPDMILTGHGGAIPFDAKVERWSVWIEEWTERMASVVSQPHPDMGLDTRWVQFSPYKVRVSPGETVGFTVTVTNHEERQSRCRLRFLAQEGTAISPPEVSLEIPARSVSSVKIDVQLPSVFRTHSLLVVADVTWNGNRLGGIAEAVAFW